MTHLSSGLMANTTWTTSFPISTHAHPASSSLWKWRMMENSPFWMCWLGDNTTVLQRLCTGSPTHTDRYLDFRSSHHPRTKAGIVKCLAHHALNVCHPSQMKAELKHLQRVFTGNNYPPDLVQRCLLKKQTNSSSPTDETNGSDTVEVINSLNSKVTHETDSTAMETKPMLLCLPYIRGLSESIERSCANLDMKIAFTAKRTLRSLLTNVKGRPTREKVKGVVYKVDCSGGSRIL